MTKNLIDQSDCIDQLTLAQLFDERVNDFCRTCAPIPLHECDAFADRDIGVPNEAVATVTASVPIAAREEWTTWELEQQAGEWDGLPLTSVDAFHLNKSIKMLNWCQRRLPEESFREVVRELKKLDSLHATYLLAQLDSHEHQLRKAK